MEARRCCFFTCFLRDLTEKSVGYRRRGCKKQFSQDNLILLPLAGAQRLPPWIVHWFLITLINTGETLDESLASGRYQRKIKFYHFAPTSLFIVIFQFQQKIIYLPPPFFLYSFHLLYTKWILGIESEGSSNSPDIFLGCFKLHFQILN